MRVWWKLLSSLFRAFFDYTRWLVPDVPYLTCATLQYLVQLEYISIFVTYFFWMVNNLKQVCINE